MQKLVGEIINVANEKTSKQEIPVKVIQVLIEGMPVHRIEGECRMIKKTAQGTALGVMVNGGKYKRVVNVIDASGKPYNKGHMSILAIPEVSKDENGALKVQYRMTEEQDAKKVYPNSGGELKTLHLTDFENREWKEGMAEIPVRVSTYISRYGNTGLNYIAV